MIYVFILFVFFSAFIVISAAILLLEGRGYLPFNDRWPPIDDDEFFRRCPPGVRRDVALRVRVIVSEQLGVDYDRVYPEQNFVKDLGCD